MIKIGVTGYNGILGKKLKKKLEKIFEVNCFRYDIRNKSKVKNWILNNKFDAIFHLAAIVPVVVCDKIPMKTCSVNIGGTQNIIDSIKILNKKPWLFYASTSHVYKKKNTKKKISEKDPVNPISFYGYTKWIGEKLISYNSDIYNFDFCCGRIFSFYDNDQPDYFLYKSIKNKLNNLNKKKNSIEIKNAFNEIDIQTSDKVVDKIYFLFTKRAKGIYNIGTGKGISIVNFAKKLSKKKIKITTKKHKKFYFVADVKKFNSLKQNE